MNLSRIFFEHLHPILDIGRGALRVVPHADARFQALSSPEPDPQVVHAAIEEVRQIASQNVIAVLGAKIDAQGARIDAQITEIRAEMKAGFTEVKAEIKAQNSRIDVLQRVIWPLIVLLTTTVFGLLYRVIITAPG